MRWLKSYPPLMAPPIIIKLLNIKYIKLIITRETLSFFIGFVKMKDIIIFISSYLKREP